MPKFRKKPVVIEAVQWMGDNGEEVQSFVGAASSLTPDMELTIHTLEGDHHASVGDWIIRGVKGEFYPCKPDIFAATYEPNPENAAAPANVRSSAPAAADPGMPRQLRSSEAARRKV